MKNYILLLTLAASFAIGQQSEPKKLTDTELVAIKEQAKTRTYKSPVDEMDLPLGGAAMIVARPDFDSNNQTFWLVALKPSRHVVFGRLCMPGTGEGLIHLSTRVFNAMQPGTTERAMIHDPTTIKRAGGAEYCFLEIYNPDTSTWYTVDVNYYARRVFFTVVGEGLTQGKGQAPGYLIAVSGQIAKNALVLLGTDILPFGRDVYPTGETRFFFESEGLRDIGALTITICQPITGCQTDIIAKNPDVWGFSKYR